MDRHKQRTLSFTGIPFIPTQDQAMTEGMGYICDRTEEHLGSSDVAIIHMRRTMLRMVENLQKGIEPYAATHPELYRVQPLDVVSEFSELDRVLEQYREQALIPA
jgi:phthalate 4,5-dioxygenase